MKKMEKVVIRMKKKFLFLLFFITISISGFTASYAAEPTKYNNTYIVNYGSTVEFTGTYSSLSSSNSDLAPISDNKIKISGAGHFTVTVNNNSSLDFFSWNTYLKKGKFWTYSSQAKKNKLNVLRSKVYLATTEINSSTFLVNDFLFAKDGSYNSSLQGKYITNY